MWSDAYKKAMKFYVSWRERDGGSVERDNNILYGRLFSKCCTPSLLLAAHVYAICEREGRLMLVDHFHLNDVIMAEIAANKT
jgi:hypothetical protein